MSRYNKLWAALVGFAVLMLLRVNDVEFFGLDAVVLELITGALTAFGVYQVRNAEDVR